MQMNDMKRQGILLAGILFLTTVLSEAVPSPVNGDGTVLDYTASIQPIFDRRCISCHGLGQGPAPAFSLVGAVAVSNLVTRRQIVSMPRGRAARRKLSPNIDPRLSSPLWILIRNGHGGVQLTVDERETLGRWIDLNRAAVASPLDVPCNRPNARPLDPAGEQALRTAVRAVLGEKVAVQPIDALVNRAVPAKSRLLELVKPDRRVEFLTYINTVFAQ